MRFKCKTCGELTNQPITKITRKIRGKRPYMPICKACYDQYREQWDAADIDRITKSTRKTVTGRKAGEISLVKGMAAKKRTVSPIYVRYDKRDSVWRALYTTKSGKKRVVPRSKSESAEEAIRMALDYCRRHGKINEEMARRYCEERELPYFPPPEKKDVA